MVGPAGLGYLAKRQALLIDRKPDETVEQPDETVEQPEASNPGRARYIK